MAEDQRSKSRCRSHSMPLSQIEASGRRGDDEEPSGSSNNLPSGSQPSGSRPSGSQPSGSRPSGSQPSGSRPSGSQPSGSRPSGSQPSGSRPSGSQPSGSRPSGGSSCSLPSGSRPSGSRPFAARPGARTSVTDEDINRLSRRMQQSLRINDERSSSDSSDDSDEDELFAPRAAPPNVRRVLGVEVRRSPNAAWSPEAAGRIQRLVRNFWPLSPVRRPTDPTEVPTDDMVLKLPLVRFLLPLPNKRVRSMSENDNPLTVVQQQATREVGQTLRRLSDEFDGHMREKRQSEEFSHLHCASSRPARAVLTLASKRTLMTGEPLIRSARPLRIGIASRRVFRRPGASNPQDLLHEEEGNEVPEPIPHQDVPRPPVNSPEPDDQGELAESSEEEEQQR